MKIIFNTFLYLAFITFAFSQSNTRVKMEFGNGTSTASNYFIEIEDRNFSAKLNIDRLKSTIRNLKFEFESDDDYNDYFQTLGSIVSASASGIRIEIKEGREGVLIDVGKISISLNNWDVHIDNNGPRNMPVFSWKLDLQNTEITPSTDMTRDLGKEEWQIFNYLSGGSGAITIKKILGNLSMTQNGKISAKGSILLPVGKIGVNLLATINQDLKSEPYINSLKLDLLNLNPEVKAWLNDIMIEENISFRKKGTGFMINLSGLISSPRFH
jgi:hypothetical protein